MEANLQSCKKRLAHSLLEQVWVLAQACSISLAETTRLIKEKEKPLKSRGFALMGMSEGRGQGKIIQSGRRCVLVFAGYQAEMATEQMTQLDAPWSESSAWLCPH